MGAAETAKAKIIFVWDRVIRRTVEGRARCGRQKPRDPEGIYRVLRAKVQSEAGSADWSWGGGTATQRSPRLR